MSIIQLECHNEDSIMTHKGLIMSSQKEVMEADVKKAIQRVCKKVLKEIENEPTLIIEAGSDNEADTTQLEDVQHWLFRRKEEYNDD